MATGVQELNMVPGADEKMWVRLLIQCNWDVAAAVECVTSGAW